MMESSNYIVRNLQTVLGRLGDLRHDLVLVGGGAVPFLLTDPAAPPARPTKDIDLVIELLTKSEFYAFEDRVRKQGFSHEKNVICRWLCDDIIVDLMPLQADILGFTNSWYKSALERNFVASLPDGTDVRVVEPPTFLCTKVEAFRSRGKDDYGNSADIEDVIKLIDGRVELLDEIKSSHKDIKTFLTCAFNEFLEQSKFHDTLPWNLPSDDASQGRVPIILDRIRRIVDLE